MREAEGEATRFSQVDAEYRKAPAVTRERLYLETMQQVLAGSKKVIVDLPKTAGEPIVLPTELFQHASPAAPPPAATAAP